MRSHLVCAMVAALAGCAESKVAEPPVLETAALADDPPVWRLSEEPIFDDGMTRSYALIDAETGETVGATFSEVLLPVHLSEDACRGMSSMPPEALPGVPLLLAEDPEGTPIVGDRSELPTMSGPR